MDQEKRSIGIGDRFARQGLAQLRAVMKAKGQGAPVAPVWNKSHREHGIIGTRPEDVRRADFRRPLERPSGNLLVAPIAVLGERPVRGGGPVVKDRSVR
jgi:hypothetical protein